MYTRLLPRKPGIPRIEILGVAFARGPESLEHHVFFDIQSVEPNVRWATVSLTPLQQIRVCSLTFFSTTSSATEITFLAVWRSGSLLDLGSGGREGRTCQHLQEGMPVSVVKRTREPLGVSDSLPKLPEPGHSGVATATRSTWAAWPDWQKLSQCDPY